MSTPDPPDAAVAEPAPAPWAADGSFALPAVPPADAAPATPLAVNGEPGVRPPPQDAADLAGGAPAMPNSHPDDQPVTWGRWTEAHAALESRVAALEAAVSRRKDRSWMLTLAVLSGLALPTVVILVGVLIHRALNA